MSETTKSTKRSYKRNISFSSNRRFGIELELNSFDGESRPPQGQKVKGIEYVANLVAERAPEYGCIIKGYEHTHNNPTWVAKPDGSCGMEIVSPPVKGWGGLKSILHVVEALQKDSKIQADHRCSVHVHLEIADLNETQLASVIAWWVKCEPVIMDAMPLSRKRNRYCQLIGMNNTFQHDGCYSASDLIHKVGDVKYYSMNTEQYVRGNRKTIEFRTIEGDGCKDAYLVKQWVRFLIHFVDMAASVGMPPAYQEPKNDDERRNVTPWTGLAWLDPKDVLTFLGFNNIPKPIPHLRRAYNYKLSKGMQQTRNWFVARLVQFMSRHKPGGIRHHAFLELQEILERDKEMGISIDPKDHLSVTEMNADLLFGDQYRF